MVNPNSNTADFIFLKKYYVSINQKAFMKKIVIVFFVVFIAAVMTSTAQTAESYFAAGLEKAEKGLYKEALADFTKVIELNPKSAVAYTNRGYAKDELGDKNGAISDYTNAIELNPQIVYTHRGVAKLAYFNRAKAYRHQGKILLTCADLQKASELGHKEAEVMIEENCKK
jgi:tetratricopeptide (TPR) repeat protein